MWEGETGEFPEGSSQCCQMPLRGPESRWLESPIDFHLEVTSDLCQSSGCSSLE